MEEKTVGTGGGEWPCILRNIAHANEEERDMHSHCLDRLQTSIQTCRISFLSSVHFLQFFRPLTIPVRLLAVSVL